MIKFNAGRVESRMAILLGFGFSEANLVRMAEDDPVVIRGEDLNVKGCNFVVFYAEDFQDRFDKVANMFGVENKGDDPIQVMKIEDNFFLVPIEQNGKVTYFIGLDDRSYEKLRSRCTFTFRMRIVEGEGDNIEVLMFWGQTEESLKKEVSELGS